jgi:hypothetical protein
MNSLPSWELERWSPSGLWRTCRSRAAIGVTIQFHLNRSRSKLPLGEKTFPRFIQPTVLTICGSWNGIRTIRTIGLVRFRRQNRIRLNSIRRLVASGWLKSSFSISRWLQRRHAPVNSSSNACGSASSCSNTSRPIAAFTLSIYFGSGTICTGSLACPQKHFN